MAKKRVGCMLAYPFEAKRLVGYPKPYIVQPKLDGNRCRLIMEGGNASLLSSTEELITGVPHISDYFQRLAERNSHVYLEIDGELYRHGWDQGKINGIVSRLYTDTLDPEHEQIEFHVFDAVTDANQAGRLLFAHAFVSFVSWSHVVHVPFELCDTYDGVIKLYNQWLKAGYEGIIVRDGSAQYKRTRSTQMMKFKEKKKDYYKIVRGIEAISEDGTPLGMIGAFECEDTMGSTFNVGAGRLSHAKRREYFEMLADLPGLWCKVGYQNLTAKRKVPRSGLCHHVSVEKENPEDG